MTTACASEDATKLDYTRILLGRMIQVWKMVGQFLIKLNISSAIALMCVYSRGEKMKIFIQNKKPNKKMYMNVHGSFLTAKSWIQPKCLSTGE